MMHYKVTNVITRQEQDANQPTAWFPENCMKLKEDKFRLILFRFNNERVNAWGGT